MHGPCNFSPTGSGGTARSIALSPSLLRTSSSDHTTRPLDPLDAATCDHEAAAPATSASANPRRRRVASALSGSRSPQVPPDSTHPSPDRRDADRSSASLRLCVESRGRRLWSLWGSAFSSRASVATLRRPSTRARMTPVATPRSAPRRTAEPTSTSRAVRSDASRGRASSRRTSARARRRSGRSR